MSDYQRFISYIYEYKNQEKAQNCGFCKVEFRNHNCRLEIHMKPGPYPYNPEFQVYTFLSINNRLQGIVLGKVRYQQGALNSIFSFSESEFTQGYSLKDLGGIFIQSDTGQIFASAWKDYEIRPASFTLDADESSTPSTYNLSEEPQDLPIHAASIEPEEMLFTDPDSPELPEYSEQPEIIDAPASPEILNNPEHTINNRSTIITKPSRTDDLSTPTNTPEMPTVQPPKNFPQDYWEDFQQTYPQVHPFFDDEIHNLLQFSCKDLDYLSTLGFSINNNRFFQHACDNFHHFLIGFTTEGNMPVLAIPGFYSDLEYYLASAFGFSQFKSAHNDRNFPGQFVYWIRPL